MVIAEGVIFVKDRLIVERGGNFILRGIIEPGCCNILAE
jgi:hypothetical protein